MKLLKALLVIPVVMFAMSCSAQSDDRRPPKGEGPPSFKELLSKMDANQDGKLAKAEVKGPLQKDFDKVDENKDGFITEKELKKAGPPKRRKE